MTDAPKPPAQQCANCYHYRLKMIGDGVEGKCHRFPPNAVLLPTPSGPITAKFFPGPKPIDYCGEWKPKLRIADSTSN